jgi:CheY-like chemotaxis protein
MSKECVILLVEDDENDAFLFRFLLGRLGFDGKLLHVWDSESAARYVEGRLPYSDRQQYPFPDFMVVDCMLSSQGCIDLPSWRKEHPLAKDMPMIFLTGGITPSARARLESFGTPVIDKTTDQKQIQENFRRALHLLPEHCRAWLKPRPQ